MKSEPSKLQGCDTESKEVCGNSELAWNLHLDALRYCKITDFDKCEQ